jgi:hypothetical protein
MLARWGAGSLGAHQVSLCGLRMVASTGFNILACFRRAWELNRTSIAVLRPYGWLLVHRQRGGLRDRALIFELLLNTYW